MSHIPVLLKEVIEILDPKAGEAVIDGTAGDGGHAEKILERIGDSGKLLLIDWDKENISKLENKMKLNKNTFCVAGNYAKLPQIMAMNNFPKADGLLLDLGFSSEQLEMRNRGFSFRSDEPLIMTYGDESESLKDFLKRVNVAELAEIIRKFGEERYAERIAEAIMENLRKINTSRELAEVIKKSVPKFYEYGRIHPATRTFQALRIYLNGELENLEKVLDLLDRILNPGGRVVIISFHSLEDRIVKLNFNESAKKGRLRLLTKKPICPSEEEVIKNFRSRSAKLRAAAII